LQRFAKPLFVTERPKLVKYQLFLDLASLAAIVHLQINAKMQLAFTIHKEIPLAKNQALFVMIKILAPPILATLLPANVFSLQSNLQNALNANLTPTAKLMAIPLISKNLARKLSVIKKENAIAAQPEPKENAKPLHVLIALLLVLVIKLPVY
jgi:hypothetical protein